MFSHLLFSSKPFFKGMVVVLLALWCYILIRAVTMCFTHDESLTFTIINGNTDWIKTANNHFLNTFLSGLSAFFLGNQEWALRLPNVLAFGIYGYYGFRLLRPLKPLYAILGSAVLFFNPFALDFFSLSRGYGLALALQMMAIYYTLVFAQYGQTRHAWRVAMAGGLMLYANFSFLVAYFALLVVCLLVHVWHQYQRVKLDMAEKTTWWAKAYFFLCQTETKKMLVLFLLVAIGSMPAIAFSFLLKAKGELYFGGSHSFWIDTVQSLLSTMVYQPPAHTSILPSMGNWALLIYSMLLLLVGKYWRNWYQSSFGIIFLLLHISWFTVLGLYYGLGILLPVERTALYFIPLIGLALAHGASTLVAALPKAGTRIAVASVSCALSTILIFNFISHVNLSHTLTWRYDADTYSALLALQKDCETRYPNVEMPIKVGAHWYLEPVINYYRITKRWTWLSPIERDDMHSAAYDYYLCFPTDTPNLACEDNKIATLQRFSLAQTLLLVTSNR